MIFVTEISLFGRHSEFICHSLPFETFTDHEQLSTVFIVNKKLVSKRILKSRALDQDPLDLQHFGFLDPDLDPRWQNIIKKLLKKLCSQPLNLKKGSWSFSIKISEREKNIWKFFDESVNLYGFGFIFLEWNESYEHWFKCDYQLKEMYLFWLSIILAFSMPHL